MAGNQKTRLNPYDSYKEWGKVTVGGILIPGIILSIDGHEKPEEWIIQKGMEVSHAYTIWRGTKLAESIKIVTNLYNRAEFNKYHDLKTVLRPKLGSKPPSLGIVGRWLPGRVGLALRHRHPQHHRADGRFGSSCRARHPDREEAWSRDYPGRHRAEGLSA